MLLVLVLFLSALVFSACGENETETVDDTLKVGIDGGSFIGPDGMQVIIPAGAIAIDVEFTIMETQPPEIEDATQVGRFYKISPTDTEFVKDITVKIPYNENSIGDEFTEADVFMWTNSSGEWQKLEDDADTDEKWAIGKSKGFGFFGPLVGGSSEPVVLLPSILTDNIIDFDLVELNDTATETLKIENKGTAELTVSGITLEGDSSFSIISDMENEINISAGASVDLEVAFAPVKQKGYNAVIEISSNDPDVSVWEVALVGIGAGSGEAELAMETIDFGYVPVGDTGEDTVTVRNLGTSGALRIISISLTGDTVFEFSEPESMMIDTEGEIEIPVTFKPVALKKYGAEMKIEVDDINNPELDVFLLGGPKDADGDYDVDEDGDLDAENLEIEDEEELEIEPEQSDDESVETDEDTEISE